MHGSRRQLRQQHGNHTGFCANFPTIDRWHSSCRLEFPMLHPLSARNLNWYILNRWFVSLALSASVALASAACSRSEAQTAPPSPPEVDAAQVLSRVARQWDEFTGRIAAPDAVDIRARVSGYIERIAFKDGDEVTAGTLLFVIDPRPYR